MVYLELFGAAEANFLFNIAEPTRFLWRIFIFDLQSMVFHVFWPSDHSPGWWLDLYYSYPLIYIYTYIYILYISYIYMCIRCWKAWREMYIYIYIGIYKGDDQNLWDSCFFFHLLYFKFHDVAGRTTTTSMRSSTPPRVGSTSTSARSSSSWHGSGSGRESILAVSTSIRTGGSSGRWVTLQR